MSFKKYFLNIYNIYIFHKTYFPFLVYLKISVGEISGNIIWRFHFIRKQEKNIYLNNI